ncbi:aspartyl protease family protein [Paraflavitalea sp. CAU 1676]|uniref:aspartyl protease family protein n=1 Tax=Paraflavitalea sp. CAU 1676 TaxID=3032598 RepID=UPI0023D9D15A|nr:aspartyl protease family protein [Paraflavitalea sp. CAU 1676]MDF2190927.1 aspartyl protease family protein [Paraflavitalea sp. CAU 1676]
MRLRSITTLLLLTLVCTSLPAQEVFVPAPAKHITSFGFRMLTGGIITLRAKLSQFPDSLTFILDTGSGGISLDSATAANIKINTVPSDRTIRGIAGSMTVRFANHQTLHLPGLDVDSLNFHINDYDILTSAYGEKIDGIVGYSFLSRYIVKVDYDSSRIHVYTKGSIKYPRGGFVLKPQLQYIPILSAQVNDARDLSARFYFDTGAGMCLLMTSDFVNDSAIVSKRRKWYATQAEGLGGKAPMKQGVVKQVKLGPYKFRNVPTYIFDDEYNVIQYPALGGLIGNDLLRRFNLIINYDRPEIHMLPNSHFKDVFDYAYTGLGMYVVEGEILVVDVMPGSPAEQAGFKPDDLIVAVQNNFSKNIQTYKNLMQMPGERLKILVLREGGPLVLTLKVKNILTGK